MRILFSILISIGILSVGLSGCGDDNPVDQGTASTASGFQVVVGAGMDEGADAVRQTPDGGFLVVGKSGVNTTQGGAQAIKMTASGEVRSTRLLRDDYQNIIDAVSTADGGMTILSNSYVIMLSKFDQNGEVVWNRHFQGFNRQSSHAMGQTPDGGYVIIGGTADSPVATEPHRLIKTDSDGQIEWEVTYDESSREMWRIASTSSGDILIIGRDRDFDTGERHVFLRTTSGQGVIKWERPLEDLELDYVSELAVTVTDEIVMVGWWSNQSYVAKVALDGRQLWLRALDWRAYGLTPLGDGGMAVAGGTRDFASACIARFDRDGKQLWLRTYGRSDADGANAVARTDNGFVIAGSSVDPDSHDFDVLVVRTDRSGNAPPLRSVTDCSPPTAVPEPPLPASPIARDWKLDRGPSNTSSFEGFATWKGGDVLGVSGRHVFQLDGTDWVMLDTQAPNLLFDIAAVDDDYLVAVGIDHTLFHFDGTHWVVFSSPANHFSYDVIGGVWGSSRSNVFAVGSHGVILHFDGSAWSQMSSGTTENVLSVWGAAPDDVWAIGQFGTIVHYDGDSWAVDYQHSGELRSIWGSSSHDIYAVGLGGTVLHFNGTLWESLNITDADLTDVDGRGVNDVYVSGGENATSGTLLHFDGNLWEDVSSFVGTGLCPPIRCVHTAASGRVFLSRADTDIRVHWFDGEEWHVSEQVKPTLRSVWAYSSDFAIAVGDRGAILKWDGASWSPMPSGTDVSLQGVFGFAPDDVFIGAEDGTFRHFDGVSWTEMYSPSLYVRDMWGSDRSNLYAAGTGLARYDGDEWIDVTPKGGISMWGIGGITKDDVYAVYGNNVWHYDGCSWRVVHVADGILRSVWCQAGPLVYAVGDAGKVVRFSGSSWESLTLNVEYMSSVWGRNSADLLAVGDGVFAKSNVFLTYDGVSWSRPRRVSAFPLIDIDGTPDGAVFAVGIAGIIVQGKAR